MDDGDRYRKLLVKASHVQQDRLVELQHGNSQHLPGNVFLPAIQQRTTTQSALSMKHLQVIEQCILAENRREEQLAKCASEKERRYLSKKFIAQREHERDLLQALMLGRPTDAELEIVDVSSQKAPSPLARRANDGTNGVRIVSASPDKVIMMCGEKTFTTTTPSNKKPTKAVSPNFHGVKSPARRREEQAKETMLPECKVSPTKPRLSPAKVRPTKSASPTSTSPTTSPTRNTKANSPLPHALANSPFRQSVRQHLRSQVEAQQQAPSPSPTKRKKRTAATTQELEETPCDDDTMSNGLDSPAVSFSGATSFHEARQQAIALMRETSGAVDDGTQTTERTSSPECSRNERLGRRDQQFVLMLTDECAASASRKAGRQNRPQSSPELRTRRRSADAHQLPALAHSPSDSVIPRFEFFHASSATDSCVGTTYTTDDRGKTIHVLSKDHLPEAIAHQLARAGAETTKAEDERWAQVAVTADSDEGENVDKGVFIVATEEDGYVDWESTDVVASSEPEVAAQEPTVDAVEDDESHVILDILYDIVHQLEERAATPAPVADVFVEKTIQVERKQARPTTAFLKNARFATRIQSAFRGLRARRAFRLALYQQALECGVLGAMPGTQQGHSGWYQDPKSFMAYYFAVQPDGEWVQKAMLRCSALVLTPYAMHEHILSCIQSPLE